jgi:hypothetical protein
LTIKPALFFASHNIARWKIDFEVLTSSFYGGTAFGYSSIVVGINQLPKVDSCSIEPQNGTTNTIFQISCNNMIDSDGFVAKVEYYSKFQYQS